MVARFANEWNPGFVDPETFVGENDLLREYCSMIGRDQSSIRRALMLTVVLGRDRAEVHEKLRRSLAWRGLQEVPTESDFDALLADPQKAMLAGGHAGGNSHANSPLGKSGSTTSNAPCL